VLNDGIERTLMANDGALLAELANLERGDIANHETIESGSFGPLPAFPEIAWRGVFADYRDAMCGTTEASDVAHFASLWATCAVTQGRLVHMFAGDRVFANVYIALFGGTGDKKTTAMRRPKNTGLLADVRIISNVGSTEGLADTLKAEGNGESVAMFFWEELTSLLARGRWKGSTILEFLTECFDCPLEWGLSYRKDPITITAPTPTVLAGTTPEWFWKNARSDDFFGGFGNRFFYLTGPKKSPLPNPSEPDPTKLATVLAGLKTLRHALGQAKFSQGAEMLWDHFYRDFEGLDRTGLFAAATKRIHVYVRKLAMTYAALEGTFPEITLDQLKAAIAVGLYGAECARLLIDSQASARPEAELEIRFIEWVRRHPGAKRRYMQQTLTKYAGSCEMFNRVVTNLIRAGVIEFSENCAYLCR
jgi:hypothetical protein